MILAVGARPIMAEHPEEVEEITEVSSALMLNLGNITDARIISMQRALSTANRKNIPVLLDLVGVTCSQLRRSFAKQLLSQGVFLCYQRKHFRDPGSRRTSVSWNRNRCRKSGRCFRGKSGVVL